MVEMKKNDAKIPESITINGVTYVVKDTPELVEFIKSVATVEKSKLYSKYEEINKRIEELKDVQVDSDGFKLESLVAALKGSFVTKDDLSTSIREIVTEVVQPITSSIERTQQETLADYRNRIITENADKCIPEIVQGNTKEELDASLQKSMEIRSRYPSPSTAHIDPNAHVTDPLLKQQAQGQENYLPPTPTPQVNNNPQPNPPVAPMTVPKIESPEPVAASSKVKKMTDKEFAAQRENLENELRSMYGN